MKYYAVVDTNVLVSALLSKREDSPVKLIFDYVINHKITPVFNDEIMSEYNDVLHRKKFCLGEEADALIGLIKIMVENVERIKSTENFPDPKDIVFYEVAIAKEDSFLVTGNIKHFPTKPFIVTPAEMVAIMQKEDLQR